ncbi:MAG: hypothetical protein JO037_04480 [Actinobacteria bacterium]|nr:hypothetical protein [Actinomycetota bacterium]
MRSSMLARRIARAAAVGLTLATAAAACSSSGTPASSPSSSTPASSAASSSPASSPASSPSSPGTSSNPAAAEIKANWEAFFDGKTSAAKKIALLQNGSKFAAIINAQAGSGLAASAGAKVTKVTVSSPTSATVAYDITLNGATALANQTGTAVNEGGTWKVGDVSFCQLLKLEGGGKAPSACSG